MSKETIVYEVKLQPVVIVLLGVIAVGVVGNVFKSVSPIQDAMANLNVTGTHLDPLNIIVVDRYGNPAKQCN